MTDVQTPAPGRESIVVTGCAGFIGSNLIDYLLEEWPDRRLIGLDALTYSGNLTNLRAAMENPRFEFVHGDIKDRSLVRSIFEPSDVTGVIHLAAESHVDRSIADPLKFLESNVTGTVTLLQEAAEAWGPGRKGRFHHVSTDEVFGSLGETGAFDESTRYDPHSPYSASKAASDHFVRAWGSTYGLEYVITNCTNNYGPFQFPEKLIPVVIGRAMAGEPVPVYGDGLNIRDWLFVGDHCEALARVFDEGRSGETYCIGGSTEVTNIDLVLTILDAFDASVGNPPHTSRELVSFVGDRPGHDFRYAMNIEKIGDELGWKPNVDLAEGLATTIEWYVNNQEWVKQVSGKEHLQFQSTWYDNLGTDE